MAVPDQSHINRVRDALWQRFGGGASVMIGSGFSRSALKIRPDAQDPPLWRDVVEEMSHKLHRGSIAKTSATKNPLKIAQEYENTFGRGDLHRFIRQTVRDGDFKPGDIHTRLLRLPWHDVFTTNWDTLLEQTCVSVPERAYSVVRNMDEIPLANRPRIVKLHGSFPAYFPLICTEKDYHTYPKKFAPFVNTVQQAMMETVFCLIGFSGNDPNFLKWLEWVRRNLGDAAPKIYLAGYLELSPHKRRKLENSNIAPIDLANHPKAEEWPEHLRHHYATEWLLHTLERGEPYDVKNWPSLDVQETETIPTRLEPVEVVTSDAPKEESWPDSSPSESQGASELIRELLGVWTHNRTIYPGWLVAPSSVQLELSSNTHEWEPRILHALSDFAPVERLKAVRELVWRRELLLEPIPSELETSAEEALKLIDCQSRTIDGVADSTVEWADVREAWRSIALALVTVARHRFDRDTFDQRIEALSPFLQDAPEVNHRLRHERCLWAMYAMDFETLEGLLKDWRTENCDPAWMMRKAAVLFETGQQNEATDLVEYALEAIRAMPADDRSLVSSSQEGWALCSVLQWDNQRTLHRRWDELASRKCDVRSDLRQIGDALSRSGKNTREAPSFDLGVRRFPGLTFSNVDPEADAYRAVRLFEVAGIHPTKIWDILGLTADQLVTSQPELAIRLVLISCTYDRDKTLQRILSRTRVAALSPHSAATLADICIGIIKYALPRMGRPGPGVYWIERMRVSMEVLSRLVLRLESDEAETIFDKALEFYRNQQIAEEPWMAEPIRNLLKRSWEALLEEHRNARILNLLSAPIVGVDGFKTNFGNYPDPGDLLKDGRSYT